MTAAVSSAAKAAAHAAMTETAAESTSHAAMAKTGARMCETARRMAAHRKAPSAGMHPR